MIEANIPVLIEQLQEIQQAARAAKALLTRYCSARRIVTLTTDQKQEALSRVLSTLNEVQVKYLAAKTTVNATQPITKQPE